jgi:predicted benzoate:H+ symporter BenE
MSQTEEHPTGDAEHMPARWWSIQWVSVRIAWALVGAGLFARAGTENTNATAIGALVVAGLVLAGLTGIALQRRRQWARDHS